MQNDQLSGTTRTEAKSNKVSNGATSELIRHAIEAWGYLVRWGSRLTLAEFAAAIRRQSSHERAEVIAAALESTTGFVARDWRGFRANWQC